MNTDSILEHSNVRFVLAITCVTLPVAMWIRSAYMYMHVCMCIVRSECCGTCVSVKSALGIPGMLRMVSSIIESLRGSSFACSCHQCFHNLPTFMWMDV